jgi:FtsZ-interacting cell division protein ZipA
MMKPWSTWRWVGVVVALAAVGLLLAWLFARVSENQENLGEAEQRSLARDAALQTALVEANERLRDAGEAPVQIPPAPQLDPDDPELQERELQEPERQDTEIQDPENQDRERQQAERDQADPDDPEQQQGEVQDAENQDAEVDDADPNDADPDDPEAQDPEVQDAEVQEPEQQDPEVNDPQDPPATFTFEFGPPLGTVVCTRVAGSPPQNPRYICEPAGQ